MHPKYQLHTKETLRETKVNGRERESTLCSVKPGEYQYNFWYSYYSLLSKYTYTTQSSIFDIVSIKLSLSQFSVSSLRINEIRDMFIIYKQMRMQQTKSINKNCQNFQTKHLYNFAFCRKQLIFVLMLKQHTNTHVWTLNKYLINKTWEYNPIGYLVNYLQFV